MRIFYDNEYKSHSNFSFDSTISKIDETRIELFECKKTIFFSLLIQNFSSFSIITIFQCASFIIIKQNDEIIKFIENFQMNQKYLKLIKYA